MSLASVLKRRVCPSCLSFRVQRFYSAQAAFARSSPPSVANSNSSSQSIEVPSPLDNSTSPTKTKKTKRAPKAPTRNLLEETKVEEYLAEIAASKDLITLEDLTRLRPKKHSNPSTPEYEVEYNQLLDRIQQAFNRKQLIHFVDLFGIPRPKRQTKPAYAVHIIEQAWGWPSLTEVQKRRRDWSEVEEEFFGLNPPQSFLFLGKDGSDLLALSREYNVHVTFSSNPLGLKVEGVRGALEHLRSHISALKEEIDEDTLILPTNEPINTSLLQRVSRISGAFAENFRPQEIRISYKRSNPRSAFVAKRLATQASCLTSNSVPLPSILTHIPPGATSSTPIPISMFPHSYALYPFLSSRTIPWLLDAKSTFRLRKVGEWLGVEATEDVAKTGGLRQGRGRVLDLQEKDVDIRELVLKSFTHDPKCQREVTAIMGHLLLPSPQASMIPPLKGSWPLSKATKWMSNHPAKHIFASSLPTVLLGSPPWNRKILHRLEYQALPPKTSTDDNRISKVLKFEMVLSAPRPAARTEPNSSDSEDGGAGLGSVEEQTSRTFQRTCSVGNEAAIDLMLPDRPMDVRFTTFEFSQATDVEWPEELRSYAEAINTFLRSSDPVSHQPETPLMLKYGNDTFLLRSSSNVRQNVENITVSGSINPVGAITESVLDLEANQKTAVCQLTCRDVSSDKDWEEFMRGCDYLSSTAQQKRKIEDLSSISL
ncbi:hypothetical protein PQX77_012694 [Marasmius sp. AFHP31]|nr:hypothetical protein PQX77_012694 [Marasmius sp. AFHP31]